MEIRQNRLVFFVVLAFVSVVVALVLVQIVWAVQTADHIEHTAMCQEYASSSMSWCMEY